MTGVEKSRSYRDLAEEKCSIALVKDISKVTSSLYFLGSAAEFEI
jgi:hypothetical protein